MKRFKLLLLTGLFALTATSFAKTSPKIQDLNSLSSEIENLLEASDYAIEEGTSVTVFFSISKNKKIQCISVASANGEVDQMLQKKLENQSVEGATWKEGVIYELSVGYADSGICPQALAD